MAAPEEDRIQAILSELAFTRSLLDQALSRNQALEIEAQELADSALEKVEAVSVIARRSSLRFVRRCENRNTELTPPHSAHEAEAALRRERNAALAKAALSEADSAFERLTASTAELCSPPASPTDVAQDEQMIGAIGASLREQAAALAARRIASAASGHPFRDLVTIAARAAAKGLSLGEAAEDVNLHPPSPLRSPVSQPIGAMRRATSKPMLALPASPQSSAHSTWVPF